MKLLKEFENFIELNQEYGGIQVIQSDVDLLIVEQYCKNEKEFREFIKWVQNEIIYNLNGTYNHLVNKEVDIINDNCRIATYII